MTRSEHGAPSDATLDGLLARSLAFEPSGAAAAAMDARVGAAIVSVPARPSRRPLGGNVLAAVRRASWRRRAVGLLVAAVVLGGAGGGLMSLYERGVGSDGGWRTAWDRATVLGVSETHDGYRVTLERAYVDAGQAMVAVSVTDVGRHGWTQVGAGPVEVTDEAGRSFGATVGMSLPDANTSAANLAWLTPPAGLAAGNHVLHISVGSVAVRDSSTPPPGESGAATKGAGSWNPWHDVAGPWTFTVTVPVLGGTAASPDVEATVAGATVRLTQVTVAGSAVNGTIEVRTADGGQWAPVGAFLHAGATYPIRSSGGAKADAPDGSPVTVQSDGGTTDASGAWTLRIDELVGLSGTDQVRLAGPWVLRFDLP